MSGFSRTNGDLQGVAVFDVPSYTNSGVNVVQAGVTVQPQGPKLNYFTLAGAELEPLDQNVGNAIAVAIETIQQLSTIHIYEYNDVGSNGNVAFAIYPAAGQTAATLQTAIRALGTVSTIDLSGVVVSNGATFTSVA